MTSEREKLDKERICRILRDRTGVTHDNVRAIVGLLLVGMINELERDRPVRIKKFGVFSVKKPKPRKIRNYVSKQDQVVKRKTFFHLKMERKLRECLLKHLTSKDL